MSPVVASPSTSADGSPRGSDISFASVPSTFSVSPTSPSLTTPTTPRCKPSSLSPSKLSSPSPSPIPLPYASTSTISRSSGLSGLSLELCPSPSSHLLEPTSTSRLPKARVFLERRPATPTPAPLSTSTDRDRPRANSAYPRHHRNRNRPQSPPLTSHRRFTQTQEPRCVSDLHEAFRAQRGAAWTPIVPAAPQQPLQNPPRIAEGLSEEARRFLIEDDDIVPSWVPHDEVRDWTPSAVIDDVQDVEAEDSCTEEESRWVDSLRNLSQLGQLAGRKEKPAIRGSVLEIRPPTVRERFGVRERKGWGRRRRGWGDRRDAVERGREERADEYVGFLVEKQEFMKEKVGRHKGRMGWLRFLKRAF